MRRLYLQVYLAMLGILAVFGILLGLSMQFGAPREEQVTRGVSAALGELLPPAAPREELDRRLGSLSRAAGARISLWSAEGALLAAAGEPVSLPSARRRRTGWRAGKNGLQATLRLPDGRWLVAWHPRRSASHGVGFLFAMTLLAGVVGVGAYPVARRLTRRLERLRAGVEGLGGGDLSARVPVEGRDEVAGLARSFNRAADRIEALVGAQRALLASASHELRSPLARLRVAVELAAAEHPELREKAAADIAELDALIEELLLASRLQSVDDVPRTDDVDLLGLAAEEAARADADADVAGEAVTVRGDAKLLRRLVRNLLENARQHGAPPVVVRVEAAGDRVRLTVCDRGPGVPEAERERIFEPFYRPAGSASTGGTGLGLSLVRQIARRHGGEVGVRPQDGGGSCFEAWLPRREP
jgi:signal transduction histidine kinase